MANKLGTASSIDKAIREQEKREKQKRLEDERRQREKIRLAKQREKALKGILATTSYYGNAAYEFAKVNRIKLLDGENLLHMLLEYGYNVRIDLDEAKENNQLIRI